MGPRRTLRPVFACLREAASAKAGISDFSTARLVQVTLRLEKGGRDHG